MVLIRAASATKPTCSSYFWTLVQFYHISIQHCLQQGKQTLTPDFHFKQNTSSINYPLQRKYKSSINQHETYSCNIFQVLTKKSRQLDLKFLGKTPKNSNSISTFGDQNTHHKPNMRVQISNIWQL